MNKVLKNILIHTIYKKSISFQFKNGLITTWSGKEFNNQGFRSIEIQALGYKINLLTCVDRHDKIGWFYKQRIYSKKYPYFSKTM